MITSEGMVTLQPEERKIDGERELMNLIVCGNRALQGNIVL